jgi:hypothetical protein
VLHPALALRQFVRRDLRKLEHAAHHENSRRQCGDTILFRRRELRGESIDLSAARNEIGERFRCWCFYWLLHQETWAAETANRNGTGRFRAVS